MSLHCAKWKRLAQINDPIKKSRVISSRLPALTHSGINMEKGRQIRFADSFCARGKPVQSAAVIMAPATLAYHSFEKSKSSYKGWDLPSLKAHDSTN